MKQKYYSWLIAGLVLTQSIFGSDEGFVNQMKRLTYQEIKEINHEISQTIHHHAKKTGYIDFAPIGGHGGVIVMQPSSAINDVNQTKSGGVNHLSGGFGGFIINLAPEWGIGATFGSLSGFTSKKVNAHFHETLVQNQFSMLTIQYKPLITERVIIDIEAGLGASMAGAKNEITDEAAPSLSTIRYNTGVAYQLGLGLRYRISSLFFVGISSGYFNGSVNNIKRGNHSDATNLTIEGSYARISLGGNF